MVTLETFTFPRILRQVRVWVRVRVRVRVRFRE